MEEARGEEEEELRKGGKTVTRWLYFCATFLLPLFSLPSREGGREGRKGGTKGGGRGGERGGGGEIGGE